MSLYASALSIIFSMCVASCLLLIFFFLPPCRLLITHPLEPGTPLARLTFHGYHTDKATPEPHDDYPRGEASGPAAVPSEADSTAEAAAGAGESVLARLGSTFA